MCGSVFYRNAETTVPATCSAASSELHSATSAILHIEMASITLSRRYQITVQHTVDDKEFRELFICPSYIQDAAEITPTFQRGIRNK
jgi:hypothetical protein